LILPHDKEALMSTRSRSRFVLPAFVFSLLFLGTACAKKQTLAPVPTAASLDRATAHEGPAPSYDSARLSVSADLVHACNIQFGEVDHAPKFDFDRSALLPQDRDVLDQVAKCVTTGPLAGRSLELVGRADPRGGVEYNFVLGEHRAASVEAYLGALGVDKAKMTETSRGELDATGTDEAGWQRDRRVDVTLPGRPR
jgi:peptidoglycan-associated lipoprotein